MYSAAVSTSSSRVSTETPSQWVPNFDHLVTQWMSVVISSEGSSLNSSHTHLFGSSTSPTMEKSHSSSGVRGVGPAESTGNPSTRYCPGGRWVSCACCLRRPRKPREKNPSLMSYTSSLFRLYSSAPLVRAACLYNDASRFFSERRPEGQRCKPDPRLASGRLAQYADRQGSAPRSCQPFPHHLRDLQHDVESRSVGTRADLALDHADAIVQPTVVGVDC